MSLEEHMNLQMLSNFKTGMVTCRIPKSLGLWPFPGELHPRAQELIYFSAYLRLLNQLVSSINEPVQ